MKTTAHTIVTDIACLKEKFNVLVICGHHNKTLAEHITLESYAMRAYPYLWVFDERFFLRHAKTLSDETVAILPEHLRSFLENSDVIIWLSQFDELEKFPAHARNAIISFWDHVYESIKAKPRLFVNLLSSECIESMGIKYKNYLQAFAKAVTVDYKKLGEVGNAFASKLNGKSLVHVYDVKGTDLTFKIDRRYVGVEGGSLKDCFLSGKECEVDVPAGEVFVAPIETSASGVLTVEEFRDYNIKNLELHFEKGKIVSFNAQKGSKIFGELLNKAEGEKDRIAEFGIGTNYGMKLTGYRIYDEKALGTAHIAIGNNIHLGGVNEASIHWDFVLYSPNIEVDGVLLMKKGKIACK
ncbi:aminopeptidase [Candidatus Bathyarchaeota archaeon]|nr:aminopeptidase [Candidatus Bathyarchaeota archaeon]